MQIINTNNIENLWRNWKHYIIDLNNELNSLIDYIVYFNPDYYTIYSSDRNNAKDYIKYEDDDDSKQIIAFLGYNMHYRESIINHEVDTTIVWLTAKTENRKTLSLPSGYACVCMSQATNQPDDKNIQDRQFAIYPIGNGGYYIWFFNKQRIISEYEANEIGNTSIKNVFNTCLTPLRYLYYNTNASEGCYCSFNEIQLNAYDDNIVVIGDNKKNIWTGDPSIIAELYYGDDEIFNDFKYNITETVNNKHEKTASVILQPQNLSLQTDNNIQHGHIKIW